MHINLAQQVMQVGSCSLWQDFVLCVLPLLVSLWLCFTGAVSSHAQPYAWNACRGGLLHAVPTTSFFDYVAACPCSPLHWPVLSGTIIPW